MLQADKEALLNTYKVRMLQIREKELEFFIQNTHQCALLSGLLTGFAYDAFTGGFIYDYVDNDLCDYSELFCAEILYPLAMIITIFLSMLTLWGCMLITMLAPRLALMGHPDAFSLCVDLVRALSSGW